MIYQLALTLLKAPKLWRWNGEKRYFNHDGTMFLFLTKQVTMILNNTHSSAFDLSNPTLVANMVIRGLV